MTDSVDTDALRAVAKLVPDLPQLEVFNLAEAIADDLNAAADEVDRLRRKLDRRQARLGDYAVELDRLRAVIENAPHMDSCRMSYLSTYPNARCTCWKADAL